MTHSSKFDNWYCKLYIGQICHYSQSIKITIISEDGTIIQTSMTHFLLLLLRNATKHNNLNDTRSVHANAQLYYSSFLPSAIREWNDLPRDIQDSSTVASFKTRLNSNIALPPPYYSTENRLDQIHHTRLRLHCSSLSQHLFSKNIIPNPLCACGEIEDTRHYLHSLPRY